MSNYTESKKRIDSIRSEYSSAGDIVFKIAICMLIQKGKSFFDNEKSYQDLRASAELEFNELVVKCANELAKINTIDLLLYIQKEICFSNDNVMGYKKITQKLKDCIDWIIGDADCSDVVKDLKYGVGFSENELRSLGYDYLFDVIDE